MSPKRPDSRSRVLVAALHCFNESGVEAACISDICARAEASVGSVYHHFGSKEGIVRALLCEGLRSHKQHLEPKLLAAGDARECVHVVVRSLIEWVAENPEWARFIYANLGQSNRSAEAEVKAVSTQYAGLIAAVFDPHIQAGALRQLPQACWASLVLGPSHDYARRWLNGQMTTAITDYAEIFASAAWRVVQASDQP
ncbi:MAG: TetR/AcrR family transcriptional regulator [Lysobacterales bacterium]